MLQTFQLVCLGVCLGAVGAVRIDGRAAKPYGPRCIEEHGIRYCVLSLAPKTGPGSPAEPVGDGIFPSRAAAAEECEHRGYDGLAVLSTPLRQALARSLIDPAPGPAPAGVPEPVRPGLLVPHWLGGNDEPNGKAREWPRGVCAARAPWSQHERAIAPRALLRRGR